MDMVVPVVVPPMIGDDFVVFDQTGCEGAGLVRVAVVVIEDKFDLLAVDAASRVDLLDQHLKRLCFRIAQKSGGAGRRNRCPDLDVGQGRRREPKRQQGGQGRRYHKTFHGSSRIMFVAVRIGRPVDGHRRTQARGQRHIDCTALPGDPGPNSVDPPRMATRKLSGSGVGERSGRAPSTSSAR
jgi:hypothetical protein